VLKVEDAIAASFEDFDFVIEAFDETTALALDEVISAFLPPSLEQLQEISKTVQTAFLNLLDPTPDFGLSL
jgi:hypothetical protein